MKGRRKGKKRRGRRKEVLLSVEISPTPEFQESVDLNIVYVKHTSLIKKKKKLSFLPPLSKIRCPWVCGFISGLYILFH